jgi:hypothetical protein
LAFARKQTNTKSLRAVPSEACVAFLETLLQWEPTKRPSSAGALNELKW